MNQNYEANAANKQLTLLLAVILGLLVFLIVLVFSNRQPNIQETETISSIGSDITYEELEIYLRSHTIDGNVPVAIKKASFAGVSFLATVHGYPDNSSVCEDLIKPYNNDPSMSVIGGEYFCQRLE